MRVAVCGDGVFPAAVLRAHTVVDPSVTTPGVGCAFTLPGSALCIKELIEPFRFVFELALVATSLS